MTSTYSRDQLDVLIGKLLHQETIQIVGTKNKIQTVTLVSSRNMANVNTKKTPLCHGIDVKKVGKTGTRLRMSLQPCRYTFTECVHHTPEVLFHPYDKRVPLGVLVPLKCLVSQLCSEGSVVVTTTGVVEGDDVGSPLSVDGIYPLLLSDICMVSYNSLLDMTNHIGTIQKTTSRSDLMKKFQLLMDDPIMHGFDRKTAETIHKHLSTFLETDDTTLGDIYENCTNIVSMYLRKKNVGEELHETILCRVQSRLRKLLYGDTAFTPISIADMIAVTIAMPTPLD